MMEENQTIRILTGNLQEIECPFNVGFNEGIRRNNRPVYMRFGGKIADDIDFIGFECMGQGVRIAYIRFYEYVTLGI
mgnify:CR=1 FL=1